MWLKYGAAILMGLLLGWLFFKDNEAAHEGHDHEMEQAGENTVWTCSMHPQVRQSEPGQCPLCGMDLIPAAGGSNSPAGANLNSLEMTPEAMAMANVSVVKVESGRAQNQLALSGKIRINEQRIAAIAANFSGRVDQLHVNYTGQEIRKGQKLASVYSPELISAQKELLEAYATRQANPALYDAAKAKLKSLKIGEDQVEAIIRSGEALSQFDIYADKSGIVTERYVALGDYVTRGSAMFDVADLSELWVTLDAYESDLPWIREGDEINFTVSAAPGQKFTARVSYIDPAINPETRAATIRAETSNPDRKLKPEMFVNATIATNLSAGGDALLIPRTAALWTGKRSVVYVKKPGAETPTFEMREVTLGPRTGEMYVVDSGLQAGEEIVTNGVFAVDASAQLQGKPSMMNIPTPTGPVHHNHDETAQSGEKREAGDAFKNQLAGALSGYLAIKDALVNSDPTAAMRAAQTFKGDLAKVDMTLVAGEAHKTWMQRLEAMQKAADQISNAGDLSVQRKAFSALTGAYYLAVTEFDVVGLDAFYQYCPMALDNAGAHWLSKTEEIRNPYFGESMLTCGEITDTLN